MSIGFKVMKWWECCLWVFADCSIVHYGVPGSPSESWMMVPEAFHLTDPRLT